MTFVRQKTKTIVFDLGGVLIDWDPRYLYRKMFDDPSRADWFVENICTLEWNERQDAGRTIAEAETELIARYPQFEKEIKAYYGRFPECFSGPIAGTVEILEKLSAQGFPLFALTNWSAETFPWARENFSFLKLFKDILVSGEVGLKKPDPKIFKLLIQKFQIEPLNSIYIDDRLSNIEAAQAFGMTGILFQNPPQLAQSLKKLVG